MNFVSKVGTFGLAAGLLLGSGQTVAAQTKEARGTVTAVSDSSLVVKSGEQSMTFIVDGGTSVEASGASTRTRQAEATGKEPAIKVTDYVKTGGAVLVSYREVAGKNHATTIRPIAAAGSASAKSDNAMKNVQGRVKSLVGASLVVNIDGHDMTFAIDRDTDVLLRGAGAASRKAGGIKVTDFVHKDDIVRVGFFETNGTMQAREIQIRGSATTPPK